MRVAVLGVTHWHAQWYLDSLRSLSGEICAVWDEDTEAAERIGYSLGVPAHEDCQQALDKGPTDLVVALPRPVHGPAVLAPAIERGLPVIAEKPLGLNASEVRGIAERADERGVFVNVMLPNRVSSIWQHALQEGSGSVVSGYFRIHNGPYGRYARWGCPWMLEASQAGGGVLRNLGIHATDAVCMLARGQQVDIVGASLTSDDPSLDIETYAVALVRFGDSTAVIDVGYNQPGDAASDFEWRIALEGQYLVDRDDTVRVSTAAGTRVEATVAMSQRYHTMVESTLRDLGAGRRPQASLWDCYHAARLVDRIYSAAGPSWASLAGAEVPA